MIWHNATAEEVLKELSVDHYRGLANGVAEERLAIYGENTVNIIEQKPLWKRFLFIDMARRVDHFLIQINCSNLLRKWKMETQK